MGVGGHFAKEGRLQLRHAGLCPHHHGQDLLRIVDIDGSLAGVTVRRVVDIAPVPHQQLRHLPAHGPRTASRLHQQGLLLLVRNPGCVLLEGFQFAVLDRQHRFVKVTHPQGTHPHRVDVLRDAPGHAAQELLGLAHGLLLPLPLLHQRLDDNLLFLLAQMHHRTAGVLLHTADFHVSGVGGVIAVERLGDGGGGEEHPVQIVAVLTQSLAGDEAPGDGLSILIPLEIYIQIDTLAGAVIGGAEDIRILGDLPAILPVAVQQKILVRQVSHALQPVLQLLEYLLRHRLAGVLQLVRVSFRGFPPLQFNNVHF